MSQRVLLADPADFRVAAAHNPHMQAASGALQEIAPERACQQWTAMADAFRAAAQEVHVLPAQDGLADLVFTANPSLLLPPTPADEAPEVWLSRMAHASRQPEVACHEAFFRGQGIACQHFPAAVGSVEGHGDLLRHPDRALLHGGVGPRSQMAAWEHLAATRPDWRMECYSLKDARFYHLDTALAPLDESHALLVPHAFDGSDLARLQQAFPHHLLLSEAESLHFAGNAWCPDRRHVFLQAGSPRVEDWLTQEGFAVVPLETGEFLKSGGSVFCLKQAF